MSCTTHGAGQKGRAKHLLRRQGPQHHNKTLAHHHHHHHHLALRLLKTRPAACSQQKKKRKTTPDSPRATAVEESRRLGHATREVSSGAFTGQQGRRRESTAAVVTLSSEGPAVYGAVAERLGIPSEGNLKGRDEEEEMESARNPEGATPGASVGDDEEGSIVAGGGGGEQAVVSGPEAAAAAVLASADREARRWLPVGGVGDAGGNEARALTRREQEGLKRHALATAALTSGIPGVKIRRGGVRVDCARMECFCARPACEQTIECMTECVCAGDVFSTVRRCETAAGRHRVCVRWNRIS